MVLLCFAMALNFFMASLTRNYGTYELPCQLDAWPGQLHRAAVRRHISASKSCGFAANLGYKEIHVEARPGDVMAAGARVGRLVQRRRFVTNLQVQQYIYIYIYIITMSCIRTMLLA